MNRFRLPPPILPCSGLLSRRDVLRVGGISVGATVLPAGWTRSEAADENAIKTADRARADSVIFLWMGDGVQSGTVIGASDAQAAWPTTVPWGPADVAATVYELLGISLDARLPDQLGRPHPVLDHGEVIAGVF